MQIFKAVFIAVCVCAGLLAQTPAPPVQAKRLPPEKSKGKASTNSDTLIDRYDFGAQINALQDTNTLQQGSPTVRPMITSNPGSTPSGDSAVPAGFKTASQRYC